jgi:hypothetical protein
VFYTYNFQIFDDRFKILSAKNETGTLDFEYTIAPILDQSIIEFEPIYKEGDTMKFDIRILDRKLNISNIVTSPEFICKGHND